MKASDILEAWNNAVGGTLGWENNIIDGRNEYGDYVRAVVKFTPDSTPVESTYFYYGSGHTYTYWEALDVLNTWWDGLLLDWSRQRVK